jgi:hypothetical protein
VGVRERCAISPLLQGRDVRHRAALQIRRPASTGVYDADMSSPGHRRPRGRQPRADVTAGTGAEAASEASPVVENIGSTLAPADTGPNDELTPLDHDGLVPIAVITAAWAVAAVVLFFMRDDLADDDRTWWLWTCIAGVGLGLLGYAYSRRRRDALRAKQG